MLTIQINEEDFCLLPQRAIYRLQNATLYIADTHWGKIATFRKHHVPLPDGALQDDLQRLSAAIEQTKPKRLVILGDLTHSQHSLDLYVVESITKWRNQFKYLCVELVPGNHDRHISQLPASWNIRILSEQVDDEGLALSHKPTTGLQKFLFCGHLHPQWQIYGKGRQQVTVPCFLQLRHSLILPAFSQFTGTTKLAIKDIEYVYGIVGDHILQVYQAR